MLAKTNALGHTFYKVMADNSETSKTVSSTVPTTKGMGKTIGASGTTITGGIITGEEYNRLLVGKFAIRQYEIMRRSEPSVEAALELVKQPLLNIERRIEPASDSPEDKFIERELFERNVDFHQMSEEAVTFLDMGFSVAEKTYQLTEYEGRTLVGIESIGFRKQISIEKWETEDKKLGITQQLLTDVADGKSRVSIVMPKLIVWTNKKEGDNYQGISLLRFAYKDWNMKDKLGIVNAIGLEKAAIPTPVIKEPQNSNPGDSDLAVQSIQHYRSNEKSYIKLPFGWALEKFDLSGQTTKELLPTLQYHDRQIFISVLAAFMALGSSDSSGSRAVGDVQYKPYVQKVATINRRFQAPIQEQLIKQLCDLNFSDLPNGYPKLVSDRFEDDDISTLANAIKSLADAGLITGDVGTEEYLRKKLHMPELSDEAKEVYDLKSKAAKDALLNPKPDPTQKPAPADDPNADPTLKKDPKKTDAAKRSIALRKAHAARQGLIDVIVG